MSESGGGHSILRPLFRAAALWQLTLLLALKTPQPCCAGPADAKTVQAASEVVLLLELDGEPLAESFLAEQRDDKLYLPICALAQAASLALTCLESRAFGFVAEESRPFVLDLESGYAIAGREVYAVQEGAYPQNGDIFVELDQLSRWLPIDFSYAADSSTLSLHPRVLLPLQAVGRRRRQFRQPVLMLPKVYRETTLPRRGLMIPTADLASAVAATHEAGSGTRLTTRNSADFSGDLMYLSDETHILAENEALKRLDVTLYRRSVDPFRVGPLPATVAALGANRPPYLDGIGASTKPLYGVYLTNRTISGAASFLSHEINGYLPQGWDAELFHNGTQIAYQPPGNDGTYHFRNLRISYGINQFKVVLHGPFGERRESEEVFVSDAITPAGEWLYTLSAGWPIGLTQSDSVADRDSNVTLTSDFGLTRELSGSLVVVRQTGPNGLEEYAGGGLRTALRNTLLSLDVIQSFSRRDDRSGQLITARVSSKELMGLNLEVVQRFLNGYDSPQFLQSADRLVTTTLLRANSSFALGELFRVPYSVELGFNTRRSGAAELTSESRVSGGWNGWAAVLEADLSHLQQTTFAAARVQVSTRQGETSIRGQAGVSFAPSLAPAAINLYADRDLKGGYQLNSGITYDPACAVTGGKLGLAKRFGLFGYFVVATGSSNGTYGVELGVRSSIAANGSGGHPVLSAEPLSPYGMIAVSTTAPAQAGAAVSVLPGVRYLVNGVPAVLAGESEGAQVITMLQPDIPVEVTLDLGSIEDPFTTPLEEGCRVVPRAGVVSSCRFTMTSGGEIDGMVLLGHFRGGEVPVKGVRVDLMSQGGGGWRPVASTRSQESGYYLFRAVKPGRYRVVVPQGESARLKSAAPAPVEVTMPEGGDVISGKDFLLETTSGTR